MPRNIIKCSRRKAENNKRSGIRGGKREDAKFAHKVKLLKMIKSQIDFQEMREEQLKQ